MLLFCLSAFIHPCPPPSPFPIPPPPLLLLSSYPFTQSKSMSRTFCLTPAKMYKLPSFLQKFMNCHLFKQASAKKTFLHGGFWYMFVLLCFIMIQIKIWILISPPHEIKKTLFPLHTKNTYSNKLFEEIFSGYFS